MNVDIIRKQPGHAPEVLNGRLGTVGMKLLAAMPDSRKATGGLTIYYNKQDVGNPHKITICDGRAYKGTIYVAATDKDGNPSGILDVDKVLLELFAATRYNRIDCRRNNWMCHHCEFIQQFEADGPFENGWNVCPHCGLTIQHPRRFFSSKPLKNRDGIEMTEK